MSTAVDNPTVHLIDLTATQLVWATVAMVIFAGIVVAAGRTLLEGRKGNADPAQGGGAPTDADQSPDMTLIRSWLAITLVAGLLLFCAASFAIDDTTLRSSLLGGLVANSGAGVAFYFASKSADQARRDILDAGQFRIVMPSLLGKNLAEIQAILASTPLHLTVPATAPDPVALCKVQYPVANQPIPATSTVMVTF